MSVSGDDRSAECNGPARFRLQDLASDGLHLLVLSGELDLLSAPDLEDTVRRLCVEEATGIVLDLRRVTFMDSWGLRAMLSTQKLCAAHSCELSLTPGPEHVQSLFHMTGLLERLPFQTAEQPPRLPHDAILPKLFAAADAEDVKDRP
jgi:anti-anti-sigma factor